MGNKKIKNTKSKEYDGILFKSLLEISFYKELIKYNIKFHYESSKITLFIGEKIRNNNIYLPTKNGLKNYVTKLQNITYKPDFTIYDKYNHIIGFIEAKGMMNDVYPIKRKLLIQWLNNNPNLAFFEVKTIKQLKEVLILLHNKYELY